MKRKKIKFNPYSSTARTEALEMEETAFARNIDYINQQSELPSFVYRDKKIIDFLNEIDMNGNILDIGERNRLTERIEEAFDIKIDSTSGDLDELYWSITDTNKFTKSYDIIIFSHVIEHLFNPLLALKKVRWYMKPDALLIICTPIKPHFVPWGKGHFHEFDDYRFKELIERAGLKIIQWEKFSNYRLNTWRSYRGFRPLLRMFYKEQSFVKIQIKNK